MSTVALIEHGQENDFIVQVYSDGRLIFVMPEREPGAPAFTSFFSESDALRRLAQCFPESDVIDDELEFKRAYEDDGYVTPGRSHKLTMLLCACGDFLSIKNPSAGMNAPYNSLVSVHYLCGSCPRHYIRSREGWNGPTYWKLWETPDSSVVECADPAEDIRNVYGFPERRLSPVLARGPFVVRPVDKPGLNEPYRVMYVSAIIDGVDVVTDLIPRSPEQARTNAYKKCNRLNAVWRKEHAVISSADDDEMIDTEL